MGDIVSIEYAAQRRRRARRQLECTGGSTWCSQVIHAGEEYTVLVKRGEWVGNWCAECRRVLGRW